MSYQDTSLWKRTLGNLDNEDVKPLRESFLEARKNAEFLLDKIRKDFPNLTVHDITHVDSLWNVADTIIGKDYPINPLEGYVLGIAFLIHDAALSYETVGGKDALRETIEWKDAFADGPGENDIEEFKKDCDFAAIRALHARKAERILGETFCRDNGTTFYIINDDIYRAHFGDLIGRIAASHHWDIDKVDSVFDIQINPLSEMPGDWEINEKKLACILRCADAGHIDNGRAPDCIYNSLLVNGVSRNHWEGQNHLGQVREDKKDPTQLRITASHPFSKKDFAAWDVVYDAVQLFDKELKKSNRLLKTIDDRLVFPHTGVCGANSKETLAEYVKTDGWQPCDIGVHTSNMKALIENLGGSKLYGEDNLLLVAMRELIQNARDAIHARSTLDEHFKEGKITIRLKDEEGNRWIELEDNGVGMSLDCIKDHLLDFGSSYWKSSLAKSENPGLRSKGFKSVGKFGIGFYSVFMVAKSVEVVTKRYDKSVDDAKKIEFPKGLSLSPILSKSELSSSVSTVVRFELKDSVDLKSSIDYHDISFQKVLQILVAGLDADVYYERNGKPQRIHENIMSSDFDKTKWLGDLFIICPTNINDLASNLEVLKDDSNDVRGMILPPEYRMIAKFPSTVFTRQLSVPCIKTIGGLLSLLQVKANYDRDGYIGYLDGKENSIDRNKMVLDESLKKCLLRWIKKKYDKAYDNIVVNDEIAIGYCSLIEFCEFKDDIVNENIRRLYTTWRFKNDLGTIKSLLKIHKYLFAGVDPFSGKFFGGYFSEEEVEILFDSQQPEWEKTKTLYSHKRLYDSKWVYKVMEISQAPVLEYEAIIKKFGSLLTCPMFRDGNKRALCVWVNLMLDQLYKKMIDWRKVDWHMLWERSFDGMPDYLNQFLIKTDDYLAEIGDQSNENT